MSNWQNQSMNYHFQNKIGTHSNTACCYHLHCIKYFLPLLALTWQYQVSKLEIELWPKCKNDIYTYISTSQVTDILAQGLHFIHPLSGWAYPNYVHFTSCFTQTTPPNRQGPPIMPILQVGPTHTSFRNHLKGQHEAVASG